MLQSVGVVLTRAQSVQLQHKARGCTDMLQFMFELEHLDMQLH